MKAETSFITGDIRYSSQKDFNLRSTEDFLFQLSELMKEYQVVKIDVCFDAFGYAKELVDSKK